MQLMPKLNHKEVRWQMDSPNKIKILKSWLKQFMLSLFLGGFERKTVPCGGELAQLETELTAALVGS